MQEADTAIFNSAQDGGRSDRLSVARGTPKLREQPRQTLRHTHYSRRTEQTHVMWDKRFIYFHNLRRQATNTGRGSFWRIRRIRGANQYVRQFRDEVRESCASTL